jgi:hypothetical protein
MAGSRLIRRLRNLFLKCCKDIVIQIKMKNVIAEGGFISQYDGGKQVNDFVSSAPSVTLRL